MLSSLSSTIAGCTETSISGCTPAILETDSFPLPPNALPTQPFGHSDHHNTNATMHDILSLFRDLSAHSPIPTALHKSADQFASRLRVLLVHERHQSEHMSTVLHGLPSRPNPGTPRRMVSQPSPMRPLNRERSAFAPVSKTSGDMLGDEPSQHHVSRYFASTYP